MGGSGALSGGNRSSQKEVPADQCRNRIARKTEEGCFIEITKHERLARAHRNAPEINVESHRRQNRLDKIMIADGGSAHRDQDVGVLRALCVLADARLIVPGNA